LKRQGKTLSSLMIYTPSFTFWCFQHEHSVLQQQLLVRWMAFLLILKPIAQLCPLTPWKAVNSLVFQGFQRSRHRDLLETLQHHFCGFTHFAQSLALSVTSKAPPPLSHRTSHQVHRRVRNDRFYANRVFYPVQHCPDYFPINRFIATNWYLTPTRVCEKNGTIGD
jgi:hypothetical protein